MDGAAITLASLIRQHQDKTGDSFAGIARKTGLSKAKIGQLAQETKPGQAHMPRPESITKLAAGLRLPLGTIQRAALVSAGLLPEEMEEPSEQRIQLVVASLRDLDAAALDTAWALVGSLRKLDARDAETVRLFAESLTRRTAEPAV